MVNSFENHRGEILQIQNKQQTFRENHVCILVSNGHYLRSQMMPMRSLWLWFASTCITCIYTFWHDTSNLDFCVPKSVESSCEKPRCLYSIGYLQYSCRGTSLMSVTMTYVNNMGCRYHREFCIHATQVNSTFASEQFIKASAHSFKQFTSRLLKLSFSLSMHLYNSDGRHA